METITQAVQSASNALWNEVDALRGGQQTQTEQRVPQQQHGDEPMSGIQGKGTVTDPYDAGNRDDQLGAPISKDNTAAMTEPLSSTKPGTVQDRDQNPNANKDDKAGLVTSNIGPSNPSFEHPEPVTGKQHTSGPAGKSTLKDEPLSTHKSTLKDEGLTSRPKPDEPATTYNTRSTDAATTAEKVNAAGPSAGLGSGIAAGAGAGALPSSAAAPSAKPPSEQRGNISFSHAQSVSQPNDKGLSSASAADFAKSESQSKSKKPSAADLSAPQAPRQVTENSSGPTTAGTGVAPTDVSKDERKEPSTAGADAGADAETNEPGSAEKLVPSTEEVAEKHGVSKEALRGPSVPPPRESYERQMQGTDSQRKKDDQPKTSKNDDKKEKHHSSMKEKLNKVLHHH
ncbi:hypothetical protein BDW72DRAFT_172528 [Aspergillus terricola var. indicus]